MGLQLKADTPHNIVDLYGRLWQEVSSVHAEWQLYRQIFARPQEELDILNTTAKSLFLTIHNIWIRDILRSIGCLSDKPTTAGKANLSLLALADIVDPAKADQELQEALQRLNDKCNFARDHRNRIIAHYDLDTKGRHPVTPLPDFSRDTIKDALTEMENVMNIVSSRFGGTPTMFSLIGNIRGEGDSLLRTLQAGLDSLRP